MKNGFSRGRAAAMGAALLFMFAGVAPAAQTVLRGEVPAAVAHLTAISPLPGAERLNLAIGLPLHNQEELNRLLQQVYDPTSPNFRHYLTPEQFTQKFGPSEEDYQKVIDFARKNGLTVTETHPNRMVLGVSGAVSNIESAFHVTLRDYQHPQEARTFYAPNVEPSVESDVPIMNVQGMNNYQLPQPMLHKMPAYGNQPASGSGPNGAYIGYDFRRAYLPGITLDGSGQIVGLLQFDGYLSSDIKLYESMAGLPDVPLENILLDGFDGSAGANNGEVCLDIETSISMAPGLTKVVVFEGYQPNSILSSMAAHPEIKQFSASWGYGIDATTDQLYQQLALQGQTFMNASGDGDAWVGPIPYGCLEDTNITLVGGTTLTMNGKAATYASEKAWNWGFEGSYTWNPDGYWGTSGGISTEVGIPIWQQDISMAANQGSTTYRNVPDVALTADNVFVVSDGGETGAFGGTSCASPLWAGFMAVVNQQAAAVGNPPIGFLAPAVYAISKTAAYTNCFHDTTTGDNTWPQSTNQFFAVAGYDLCTGLGTPKGSGLIYQLAGRAPRTGYLRLAIDPSSGSTLLNVSTQQVFVTVNDGGFAVTNATVTVSIPGVTNLTLLNDGQSPDAQADDAVYSGAFTVPSAVSSLTMSVAASATNEIGTTNVVYYSVVPVPLNDNFSSSIKVPALGATYQSNNRFATIETNEPPHDGSSSAAGSLWWSWTPTANTNVAINTIGSKIDTLLAVYTGTSLATLHPIAATNSLLTQFQPAYLTFNAQAGVNYRIAVAGVNSNLLGSLVLQVAPGGQRDITAPVVSVLSPLSGQSVNNHSMVISGVAADLPPNATGVSLVSVSINGIVTPATGTTNWTAAVAFSPALNNIFVTAVDAAGNLSSPATVQVNYLVPTEPNDFFANAIALTGSSGVVSAVNTNATRENGEPYIAGNPGGKSIWWLFTPTTDGMLSLNTTNSSFDTLLGLYTGPAVNQLTSIAENDDAYPGAFRGFSFINQAVRANQTYAIAVDGFSGEFGSVSLDYTFTPATIYHLTVGSTAGGTVQLTTVNSLGGIAESPGSSADFVSGTTVTLEALPYATSEFNQWTGDVAATSNPLPVAVQSNLNVTANFSAIPYTDGFESGNLTHLTWATAGNAPWYVQTNVVAEGMYAASSGPITNDQTSSLILTTNFVAGLASFDYKVSSETNWDFLNFFVDGVLYKQWSGEVGWANYTFALNSGQHTLKWTYSKDPSLISGLDAAFIDDVNLPIASPVILPPDLLLQNQGNGMLLMTLTGQEGVPYLIQSSTNLMDWRNFSTNTAVGGIIQIPIPNNLSNQAQFYRASAP